MAFIKSRISASQSVIVVALVLCGLLIRMYRISAIGLWHDEGITYLMSFLDWQQTFSLLRNYVFAPPLFYFFVKPWTWLFPQLPWVIRLPSLFASGASLILIYHWLNRRIPGQAAIFALFLLALSPNALLYAQEGRTYACLSFFYLLAIYSIDQIHLKPSRIHLLGFIVSSACIYYLHGTGIIFCISLNLYFWLSSPEFSIQKLRTWILTQVFTGVALLPWLPLLFSQRKMVAKSASIPQEWQGSNWFSALIDSLRNLAPGDIGARSIVPFPALPTYSYAISLLMLAIFIAAKPWKKWRVYQSLFVAILFPLLFLGLYSDFISPVYQIGRSEAPMLPLFCALLGMIVAELKPQALKYGALAILGLTSLYSIGIYFFSVDYPQKKWDLLTVQAALRDDSPNLVILDIDVRASLPAYLKAANTPLPVILFPDAAAPQGDSWAKRFYLLQRQGDARPATVQKSLEHIQAYLQNQNPQRLEILAALSSPNAAEPPKPSFYVDQLLNILEEKGFVLIHAPAVTPMDWQRNGFHGAFTLKRP